MIMNRIAISVALLCTAAWAAPLQADARMEYPCHLVNVYNPDADCLNGITPENKYGPGVRAYPRDWLVGPPPSQYSALTLPINHWVELQYKNLLVDGLDYDLEVAEMGTNAEDAFIFLIDRAGREYPIGLATADNTQTQSPTYIRFDLSDVDPNFNASAVRVVGLDMLGGSPGFDIHHLKARVADTAPNKAYRPVPVDGGKGIDAQTLLSWSGPAFADSHILYFGTNLADVVDGADAVKYGPLDVNSFDPGPLRLNTRYFWRVDEVSTNRPFEPWTGDVWTFETIDQITVEDFDSYRTYADIWPVWKETAFGYGGMTLETTIARSCSQAGRFGYTYYDQNLFAEVTRQFESPQNWTAMGVRSIDLYFRGREDNDHYGQFYFGIADSTGGAIIGYDADPNHISRPVWQLWRINLDEVNGIDFSAVSSISLGYRDDDDPNMMGNLAGSIYIDDIILHPARCMPQFSPPGDLNADCLVNAADLDEVAYSWLHSQRKVLQVSEPAEPLACYEFEGNLRDSAGLVQGARIGDPTYVPGVNGIAIRFDGIDDAVSLTNARELFAQIRNQITIAFWQFGTDSPHHIDTVCCSNFEYNGAKPALAINLGLWLRPGRYNFDCGFPWSLENRLTGEHHRQTEWTGRWNHWTFVKNAASLEDPNKPGTIKIYLNGVLYDSRTGSESPVSRIDEFQIGNGWYGGYDGMLDDFRIYDYALTEPEAAYLATGGTGVFDNALLSGADLSGDQRINFHDLAIMTQNWMLNTLWPQ